ncbi:hypothetical protein, partial [Paenibacillus polymyxa]|uniref:hypothetical protein n=1 Tax=Paenibacillus polymyxa TaxID=1406 RepID=UPI0006C6F710
MNKEHLQLLSIHNTSLNSEGDTPFLAIPEEEILLSVIIFIHDFVNESLIENKSLRRLISLSLTYKNLLEVNFNEDSWRKAVGEYGRKSGRYTWNVCDIYIKEISR